MESVNFLQGTKLPSIGCFLTLMTYYGNRKEVKRTLLALNKLKGNVFYLKHVEESTQFTDSNRQKTPKHVISLNFGQPTVYKANLTKTVPLPGIQKLYFDLVSIQSDGLANLVRFMENYAQIKYVIVKMTISSTQEVSAASFKEPFLIMMSLIHQVRNLKVQTADMYTQLRKYVFENDLAFNKLDNLCRFTVSITKSSAADIDKFVLPKRLDHLRVNFEKSYCQEIIKAHLVVAKLIGQMEGLRSLTIHGLGMMKPDIDQGWADALYQNLSIKDLKLKSSVSLYGAGEKIFYALKNRKTRLDRFILKDYLLTDQDLYFFTAFVRSHKYFSEFQMQGNCFSSVGIQQTKKMLDQHSQTPAIINTLNEVLSKRHHHLQMRITDQYLFDGQLGTKMFKPILENFKGDKLTLSACLTKGVSLDKVFAQTQTLTHLELNSIKFDSTAQKRAIFEALAAQPQFKGLKIVNCNVEDSDFKYLQGTHKSKYFNRFHLDKLTCTSFSNLENLMKVVGKQLNFFSLENIDINFADCVKLASCLDPEKILSLTLLYKVNVDFKAPTEDHAKLNDIMLHYLSNMKSIKELKISFQQIDQALLDRFGQILAVMGKKLVKFTLLCGGTLDPDIVPYGGVKSMSSADYQKWMGKDYSLLGDVYDVFCKGLSECTSLVLLDLMSPLNNQYFLERLTKHIRENPKDRSLQYIKNPWNRPDPQLSFM